MEKNYSKYNRDAVLVEVEKLIAELEDKKEQAVNKVRESYDYRVSSWYVKSRINSASREVRLRIRNVCDKLSIFDWWKDYLSLSQLKQMRSFLVTTGKLGFNGYVCFKVGSVGCSHGMWCYVKESTNGYSPDGAFLFHSFVSGENYWSCYDVNKEPIGNEDLDEYGHRKKWKFTLKDVKEFMATHDMGM